MSARRLLGSLAVIASAAVVAPPAALAAPGAVDTSFGTNGTVTSQFSNPLAVSVATLATSVATAANGDIYQAGVATDASNYPELYLARFLPNGTLDRSFGVGGVAAQQIGLGSVKRSGAGFGQPQHIAIAPSGDIVVPTSASDASGNSEIAVAEFKPSGKLDTSFAAGGPMPGVYYDDSTSTAASAALSADANAAVVQSDGKIVFSAFAQPAGGPETFVRRLNANGTVDKSFASGGTYTPPAGTMTVPTEINDIILNAAGNTVFAGATPGAGGDPEIMLGELNPHGTVTSGFPVLFQPSASVVSSPVAGAYSLLQAADGDYIVGAYSTVSQKLVMPPSTYTPTVGWVVAAFKPSGAVDASFGTRGSGYTALGPDSDLPNPTLTPVSPFSIAQQADGRLVYTGLSGVLSFVVGRTLANGKPDPSFGSDGLESYLFSLAQFSDALAIEPNGELVLSGLDFTPSSPGGNALMTKIILDPPPSVVIAAGPAVVGQPVSFSAVTVSDSPISKIKWDLGSGSFTDATGPTATKTFASSGTYTVRVEATDDDKISTIATRTVTVAPTSLPASECTSSIRPTAWITSKILAPQGLLIAGTAAAHCPTLVHSVSIAIARIKRRQCSFLLANHRWGRYGNCEPKAYLAATGTYSWGFGLRLKFAPATYWVWPRATDTRRVSTANNAGVHTTLKLR
jgi:uncharacterized delta-60 repeat protein